MQSYVRVYQLFLKCYYWCGSEECFPSAADFPQCVHPDTDAVCTPNLCINQGRSICSCCFRGA